MEKNRTLASLVILVAVVFATIAPYVEAEANRGGVLYRLRNHGTTKLFNNGFYFQSEPKAQYTSSGQIAWFNEYLYPGTYRFHALKDKDVSGNIQVAVSVNNTWLRTSRITRNWPSTSNFRVNRPGWYSIAVWNGGTGPNGGWVGIQYGQR